MIHGSDNACTFFFVYTRIVEVKYLIERSHAQSHDVLETKTFHYIQEHFFSISISVLRASAGAFPSKKDSNDQESIQSST